jgi:glycolate oxidase
LINWYLIRHKGSDEMMKYNYKPVRPAIVDTLKTICSEAHVIFGNEKKLQKYSHDQIPEKKYAHMPEVVVMPRTAAEIAEIIKLANRENIPVTPRAAGSGLSGGAVPIYGGILLSVERMDKIVEIDAQNLMAVVEPGVVTNKFDEALKEHGLFFAGYPMSEEFCFIGGNVAENAGGGRAIKYGVTGRYICGIEVVTPTGEIMQLGGKRIKDVTGYNLLGLMVGSEGTLGIFTQITIKLLPRPSVRKAILVLFENVGTAVAVIPHVMTVGNLIPSAVEFMDGTSFCETAKSLKENFPYDNIGAVLLFEVDGNHEKQAMENAEIICKLCTDKGAIEYHLASTDDEIDRFWKIRKRIPWVLKRYSAYQSAEDIVVPIANIPKILHHLQNLAKEYNVLIPVFGHAGDGNLHAHPIKNPEQSLDDWEVMLPKLLTDIYTQTAKMGGTISGEHGIGHKRRDYLGLVMSDAQVAVMRKIKKALDPNNILNPGKIFHTTTDSSFDQ